MSDNPFDDVTSIDELLAQLAGGASVCWENPSGAGSFDPGTASDLVDAAKERLVELMGQRQNRREAWHEGYVAGAESAHRFHRGVLVPYDNPYSDTSDEEVEEGPAPHRLDSVWTFEREVDVHTWPGGIRMFHRPTGTVASQEKYTPPPQQFAEVKERLGSLLTTWTPEEAL